MFDHEAKLVTVYGKKEKGVKREEAIVFGNTEVYISFKYEADHSFTDLWNEYYIPGIVTCWNFMYGSCEHGKVPFECPTCNPPKNRIPESPIVDGSIIT
jgi:hypothetical protein